MCRVRRCGPGGSSVLFGNVSMQMGECDRIISAEIDEICVKAEIGPHDLLSTLTGVMLDGASRSGMGRRPAWADLRATVVLKGVKLNRDLFLDHQVLQTPPFRLEIERFKTCSEKEACKETTCNSNIELQRESGTERVVPSWEIAYTLKERKKKESENGVVTASACRLELGMVGCPATAFWLSDGFGFPVYRDIRVKKITLCAVFCGLSPEKPRYFWSDFRRREYSMLNEAATVVKEEELQQTECNGDKQLVFRRAWPRNGEGGGDAAATVGGHFVGIRWNSLEEV